ncbi:MAG: hypothetical protein GX900_00710 [Clostridiaceae bacterium]|nr:hypothetical protein [Clostridiaceae bacterium]
MSSPLDAERLDRDFAAAEAALLQKESEPLAAARQVALGYLSRGMQPESRVRTKMREAGVAADLIDRVTAELKSCNLINDYELACLYLQQRIDSHPEGARVMRERLAARGYDPEAAARAVEDLMPSDEELLAAYVSRRRSALRRIAAECYDAETERIDPHTRAFEKELRRALNRGFAYNASRDALIRSLEEILNDN